MSVVISGTTGITTPADSFAGATSGAVTVQGDAVAGTWTFTLPTTAGTNGYVLSTNGSGVTSWVAQTGGSGGTSTGGNIFLADFFGGF